MEVRRAADRARSRSRGIETWHSFSFGAHYDPANVRHGVLVAHNEERLEAGARFEDHTHRDVEILTWVLEGRLSHTDSTGRRSEVPVGSLQRLSAGAGIVHSEGSEEGPVRFVQMWVMPDEAGGEPAYEQHQVDCPTGTGSAVLATGSPDRQSLVRIRSRGATLHLLRLEAGGELPVPVAGYVHVFVARGTVELGGAGLSEGDAARFTDSEPSVIAGIAPISEVLVWEMEQ